jgi:hypothetical protein
LILKTNCRKATPLDTRERIDSLMSKKKLLFAEERGFMRKTYNVLLEIPYAKVSESAVEKNQLVFEASGKKYRITPEEVSPFTIPKSFSFFKLSSNA